MLRDTAAIKNYQRCLQPLQDRVGYFFGDTTVIVQERLGTDGKIHLTPIEGDQIVCGEWTDLIERELKEYCKLLEEEVNRRSEAS